MSKTLSDLRKKCYDILREEENNSAYPYSLIDDLLNTAQQKVGSWLVINPLNWMEVHKWQLPFLNKEVFYESYAIKYVAQDVEIWATEIFCTTGEYPSEWHLYIGWDIIKYWWKLDDRFTKCENITRKIKWWEQISFVYEVPSDFMCPVNVIYNDTIQIYNKDYDDVFEWLRDWKWRPDYRYPRFRGYWKPFYTIKDDLYLVVYNINTSGISLRLRYEKIPTPMIDANDVCMIPNDIYAMSVIPYLAVWETMYNRWEEQRWAEVINFWMGQLREMYQFYNRTGIERMTSKNYRMAKWKFNI